jgi:hypothetical protein
MEFTGCPSSDPEAGTRLSKLIFRPAGLDHLKRLGIIDTELASGLDQAVLCIQSSRCIIVRFTRNQKMATIHSALYMRLPNVIYDISMSDKTRDGSQGDPRRWMYRIHSIPRGSEAGRYMSPRFTLDLWSQFAIGLLNGWGHIRHKAPICSFTKSLSCSEGLDSLFCGSLVL